MQLRQLGSSELKVTPVIFGAWAIGGWMWGGTEERESVEAIVAALDSGVNTIDTAAIYGMGYSEELVAKAMEGRRRGDVVIATKCGMRWDLAQGSDPWAQKDNQGRDVTIYKNGRAQSIAYECEQSLRRLKTDYIDLYQLHWPDVSTPVQESIGALAKLKEQGKVRAIGVSNFDLPLLKEALKVSKLASLQPPYSLIQRTIEREILPYCRQADVGVIVYSPLERGLLTGTVSPERVFADGDHRAKHKFFTAENRQRVHKALEVIRPIAEAHKASLAQLVINWTIHEPGITAALVGARNAEQAAHNAKAMNFTLDDSERAAIRAAFDEPSRVMMAEGAPARVK